MNPFLVDADAGEKFQERCEIHKIDKENGGCQKHLAAGQGFSILVLLLFSAEYFNFFLHEWKRYCLIVLNNANSKGNN